MSENLNFNPDEFMQATIDEVFDDHSTPVDAKEYDNAYIKPESVKFYAGESTDKKTGEARPWRRVSMYFQFEDAEQTEKTGIATPGVSYSFFLDLAADGKSLASGPNRNVALGALRKALGQESAPWSFQMLEGAGPVRIKVAHEEGRDGNPRAVVVAVTKQS